MISRRLGFALAALLLGLTGCAHKTPPTLIVATEQAPQVDPSTITVITPLPSIPEETPPAVTKSQPPPKPAPAPKKASHPRRRTHHHTDTEVAAASPATTPEAEPPSPTLGQLSTGTAIDQRERTRFLEMIGQQEERLKKQAPADTPEGRTELAQAQTFLAKARQAVDQNDLDGARTLTTKAQVLLDEQQQQ